jgi:hypothetical protein
MKRCWFLLLLTIVGCAKPKPPSPPVVTYDCTTVNCIRRAQIQFTWDFIPFEASNIAGADGATTSCIKGFEVYKMSGTVADINADVQVASALPVLNSDGTVSAAPGAQSAITGQQPVGAQVYYVVTVADQAGRRIVSVPSNVIAVVLGPAPAAKWNDQTQQCVCP